MSQGIIFKITDIPELTDRTFKIGEDVTELLGITKYDPQAVQEQNESAQKLREPKSKITKYMMRYKWFRKLYVKIYGTKSSTFPSFIHKTDENRFQEHPGNLVKYKD